AASFSSPANRGKCSLMRMPGTAVGISLKGPPWAVPGFRSKVSLWLGPPSIHSRMHDLCLAPVAAARPASTLSQPDSDAPVTPAAVSLSRSRRDRPPGELPFSMGGFLVGRSAVSNQPVKDDPRVWG